MKINFMITAALLSANALAATATKSKETVAQAYEKAANLNEASFVTEIVFNKDSSELSADGKSQLRDILKAAQERGKVEAVKILAWADKDYPQKPTAQWGNDARKLADERALEIKGYVEDATKNVNVDTHNMAERPDALTSFIKSSDVKVKKNLERAGLSNPQQTGMPSKSGRALVMVIIQ